MDRYFTAGLEYCEDHGLDLWARYLSVYSARTELDRGRWAAAARAIPPTVERPGSVLPRIGALVVLGLLRARRGDPGPWVLLDEAAELADRSGELQWMAPVSAARAEAAVAGRPARRRDRLGRRPPGVRRRAGRVVGGRDRLVATVRGDRRARPGQRRRAMGAPAGRCRLRPRRRPGGASAVPTRRRWPWPRATTRTTSAWRSPASTRSVPARPRPSSLGGCATPATRLCRAACARRHAPTLPA